GPGRLVDVLADGPLVLGACRQPLYLRMLGGGPEEGRPEGRVRPGGEDRVVKTGKSRSSSSQRKVTSAPSERPIQLRCMVITFSGHDSSRAKSSSSCWAYSVILKNHCSSWRSSTSVPQRSQCPSITCSLASTVWSLGHQCTG